MYQIANKAQDFQYETEVCPPVQFRNLDIDDTTDQETVDMNQQGGT